MTGTIDPSPGHGTQNPPPRWLPRASIQARVECEDEFDLAHLVPHAHRADPHWLAATLAAETLEVLSQLAGELRRLELPGLEHVDVELEGDNWRISGKAMPEVDGVRLSLSMGFALAVEEATLEFLSWDDALCPMQALRGGDAVEPRASKIERYAFEEEDRVGRFVTYGHLKCSGAAADNVTSGFPANLWRLRQQELLSALVIRWAALHEIAHGTLCHLDLIRAFFGHTGVGLGLLEDAPLLGERVERDAWASFGYSEPPVPNTSEAPIRQVLELHADTCASWLAFDLERAAREAGEAGEGLFEAYERDMAALGADPAHQFVRLSPDNRVHFLLLAGLIAILLFEFGRREGGQGSGGTHPLPEARLIAMIRESFYGSDLAQSDGEGGFRIVIPPGDLYPEKNSSAWNRFIQDGPARAMEDMEFFSTVLDMDIALFGAETDSVPEVPIEYHDDGYLKGVPDLDQSRMSRWWQDVLGRGELVAASLRGEAADVVPLSDGGKQLRELDIYQLPINRITELLQQRSGRPALALLLTQRNQRPDPAHD